MAIRWFVSVGELFTGQMITDHLHTFYCVTCYIVSQFSPRPLQRLPLNRHVHNGCGHKIWRYSWDCIQTLMILPYLCRRAGEAGVASKEGGKKYVLTCFKKVVSFRNLRCVHDILVSYCTFIKELLPLTCCCFTDCGLNLKKKVYFEAAVFSEPMIQIIFNQSYYTVDIWHCIC